MVRCGRRSVLPISRSIGTVSSGMNGWPVEPFGAIGLGSGTSQIVYRTSAWRPDLASILIPASGRMFCEGLGVSAPRGYMREIRDRYLLRHACRSKSNCIIYGKSCGLAIELLNISFYHDAYNGSKRKRWLR